MPTPKKYRAWIWITILVVIAGGTSVAIAKFARHPVSIPTAFVRRGTFTQYLELRGSVVASRSIALKVPAQAGGQVRILKIASNSSEVKRGEVVIQFDASQLEQTLHSDQVTLKQAEATIGDTRAKTEQIGEKDKTALLKAQFTLEQDRLKAAQKEILAKIDGEEDELKVVDDQTAVVEAEQQLKSDEADGKAQVDGKIAPRDKAEADVRRIQAELAAMAVKAPIDGMISILPNPPWNDNAPLYRPGDQVGPGSEIAELPDLTTLEVEVRVDEVDRGKIRPGEPVNVRVDAVPGRVLRGAVANIGTLARIDFSAGFPWPRNFDTKVRLLDSDPRLRPGMSAGLRIAIETIPGAVLIPAKAAFQQSGQTVAYVLQDSKFVARRVDASRPSDGEVAVFSGLTAGEKVALKQPLEKQQ
ncbi:MAG: efflux RND transporter periplasmic adaptor subunit [Terriglobia bacterium]